jgi:hypothetical protein
MPAIRNIKKFPRACFSALALAFLVTRSGTALAGAAQDKVFAQRACAAYDQARAQYLSQTNNPVLACEFARTCFDWAGWATNKAQRAEIAQQGIAACRRGLLFTNSAAPHYYLALNLGQLAQAETFSALKIVREMSREFLAAKDLDARFDFAGPDRSLGLLYRDAPGWPLSIGNKARAREFLEEAIELAPDYPENILNLAESEVKWGETPGARQQLAALDALWPKAQITLAGQAWEPSWDDWSSRRDELRKQLKR